MKVLVCSLLALLSFALCGAEIYYPGTFDPFHNTHFNEVMEAQKQVKDARVIIAPIEWAYYTILSDGTKRPIFVDHITKCALIESSFKGHAQVATSHRLRYTDRPVFEMLRELASDSNDPEKYLLVGTDVLALWKDMPGFDGLRHHFRFIISRDPRNIEQGAQLESQFRLDPAFIFITADNLGLRSTLVLNRLFSNDALNDIVPKSFADYFNDPARKQDLVSKFWNQCVAFANNLAILDLAGRLGPLCEAEKQQVIALVHGYLFQSNPCVSPHLQSAFDELFGEGPLHSPYLRSTLLLYRGWAKRDSV